MKDSQDYQIAKAIRDGLSELAQPISRLQPKIVKIGLTAGDFTSSDRPLYAVMAVRKRLEPGPLGPRHTKTLTVVVYVETADVDDSHRVLLACIADIEEWVERNEKLAGLVLVPLRVVDWDSNLDLDASAGIASAMITIEAVYRTAH